MKTRASRIAVTCLSASLLLLLFASLLARGQNTPPKYDVDPSWPKPLPNRWVIGQVGGVCVDREDHIFLLNRQDLKDEEFDAGRMAPAVIEFDAQGSVVSSWENAKQLPRGLHSCTVDKDDNIWIVGEGAGMAQKYTHDGTKLLLTVGSEDLRLSGIVVDSANGDIYVTSGRTNPSVVVFDRNGQRLRSWTLQRKETEKAILQNLHCVGVSNEGLVYVCDRLAHRLQVFDKMGNFKKMIDVPWQQYTAYDGKRKTGEYGSASMLSFSRDPNQQFMYVINEDNEQINILDRDTGKLLSTFGRGAGHFIGQFTHAHSIAVDSKGNVYIGETDDGKRAQKFTIMK